MLFDEVDLLVEYYFENKFYFKERYLELAFKELFNDRNVLKKRAKLSEDNFRIMYNNILNIYQQFLEIVSKYKDVSYIIIFRIQI